MTCRNSGTCPLALWQLSLIEHERWNNLHRRMASISDLRFLLVSVRRTETEKCGTSVPEIYLQVSTL
jgi:hypothetical protein